MAKKKKANVARKKAKATKKRTKVAKKETKVAKKESSSKRPVGTVSKVGITQTWAKLFQENEKAPKAKRLTDAQISAMMMKNFPDRKSKVFLERNVHSVRNGYNHGRLDKGTVPGIQSCRYGEDGEAIKGRVQGQSKGGSRTGEKKVVRRVRAKVKRAKAVTA